MWYMCTPSNGGIGQTVPVPLAKTQWHATFQVRSAHTQGVTTWNISCAALPSADPMLDTYLYPQWTGTRTNDPAADTFVFQQKSKRNVTPP